MNSQSLIIDDRLPRYFYSALHRLKAAFLLTSVFLASFAWASTSWAQNPPPLRIFSTIAADSIGRKLDASLIWTDPPLNGSGVAVAFRKTFDLSERPTRAVLSIFADARYVLWVNGTYVDRGPSRFQPNGPQYDVINVATHLQSGRNALVLLVVGNLSGGKVMRHAPGLTALLEADGHEILHTDSSWKWSNGTRFQTITASWANLGDTLVDARVETGDWTGTDYDDAAWKPAGKISQDGWGPLTRTLIPPLRENEVPITFHGNVTLPVTLKAGEKLEFDTGRIVQAYPIVELDADADTDLSFEPFGVKYLAHGPSKPFHNRHPRNFTRCARRQIGSRDDHQP